MTCVMPAELLADMMDESRGVCNDEAMMARKLNTALVYLNGLADWEHNKTIVRLSKGMHQSNGITAIHGQGCSAEAVVCQPCPPTVKRFGDKILAPCDLFLAVTRSGRIDFTDTDNCIEMPDGFREALFYLGKAMAAGQDQKQLEFAISTQMFQMLIGTALDANENLKWSVESARIPQVSEKDYRR